ncbi:helix-turn-helix domain-containing protein [Paenibacillus motobuensis]|uniref:HTH cro/C1-type domain-containing protein n=1 Tax=Paenibacillus motobuensis TaxID=295324 RepID=A0ABP3IAE9_9BACL
MSYSLGRCRLKDIRREIGWTQRKLSDATGIKKDVLSKYENDTNTITYINSIIITETIYDKTGIRYSPRDLYEIIRN